MIALRSPALATALAVAGTVSAAGQIDATGLYALPDADIVVLGEVHDNPVHHAHQAIAIEALSPRAVVYEMLTDEQAGRVTPPLLASEAALGATLGWEGSGWPDFAMYYPVFVAGGEAEVVGAAAPREDVRRATDEGAAAVFGSGAARYGIDAPLAEPEQLLREAGQLTAHCGALPADLLPGMVEAQRLRDAWIARAALDALAEHGPPVAVVTGNGHARADWGVPRMIAAADPKVRVFSLGQFEDEAWPDPPFDAWLITDAAPRPDPCEVFR